MPRNRIEVGDVVLHMKNAEETTLTLRELLRPMTNQEVADFLNTTERTVRRWRTNGRLPAKRHERLSVLQILRHEVETAR